MSVSDSHEAVNTDECESVVLEAHNPVMSEFTETQPKENTMKNNNEVSEVEGPHTYVVGNDISCDRCGHPFNHVMHNNPKENTMKEVPTCQAIQGPKAQTPRCPHPGIYTMQGQALGDDIYAKGFAPRDGYLLTEVHVCGTHHTKLLAAKTDSMKFWVPRLEVITTTKEEKKVYDNITVEQLTTLMKKVDLDKVHALIDPEAKTKKGQVSIITTNPVDTLDPARAGYVYNGSDYVGQFRMNKGMFVLLSDRGEKSDVFGASEFLDLKHRAQKTTTPGAIQENHVHTTKVAGRVKEWIEVREEAVAQANKLREDDFKGVIGYPAGNGNGFWVYWNARPELMKTNRPITKREKVVGEHEGILCGKCSTWETPAYHDSNVEVKACHLGGK
jgi:hypothetical protein